MPEIVLATLNARYVHAAFGLRYLMANLGELQSRAAIREFDINQRVIDIVESVLAENATIAGFGVYIWNVELTTKVVADLKRLRRLGYRAFLIGERFMTTPDPGEELRALVAASRGTEGKVVAIESARGARS